MSDWYEPYSKRQRKLARSGTPAVYQYDTFPRAFRVQAYYSLRSAIGEYQFDHFGEDSNSRTNAAWNFIAEFLAEEHGSLDIASNQVISQHKWLSYLLALEDRDQIVDAIEIAFRVAVSVVLNETAYDEEEVERVRAFVSILNRRFREHDLGYEFVSAGGLGLIIKIDSQYVHAEVVEPAIANLYAAGLEGPLAEFEKAHRDYRRGDYKSAMNEAHKAFESTMKAIYADRGWAHDANGNASKLIPVMFREGLVPASLQDYINALEKILGSGVPTLRNKLSAHGGGASVVDLPNYFAAFALHLAAANIVFLMSAHQVPTTAGTNQAAP